MILERKREGEGTTGERSGRGTPSKRVGGRKEGQVRTNDLGEEEKKERGVSQKAEGGNRREVEERRK